MKLNVIENIAIGFLILTLGITPFVVLGILVGPNYLVGIILVGLFICLMLMISWEIGDVVREVRRGNKDAER